MLFKSMAILHVGLGNYLFEVNSLLF